MKPFFKAIKLSLRYKWSIVGAVLCSMAIAVLWSTSITTILPFVEIVFKQQGTLVDLVTDKIEDQKNEITQHEQEIADLKVALASAAPTTRDRLQTKLEKSETQISYEKQKLAWLEWLHPIASNYAPSTPFVTLLFIIGWLLFATILKGAFIVMGTVFVARVANGTAFDMRRMYFRKALEIDQHLIDHAGTSRLMTNLSHNMEMINGGISVFYGKAVREPLKMIACLAMAAAISFPLLIISLILVPVGGLLINYLAKQMKRAIQKEIGGMAAVFQSLIESFNGIKTVRIFTRERTERHKFKQNSRVLYRMGTRMSFFDSIIRPISEVLGIASISIAMLVGAYLVLNGETHIFGIRILRTKMDASVLMLFYALLAGASDPARKMTEVINVIVRAGTACETLFKTFDSAPRVRAPENPITLKPHSEKIEFDKVWFQYVAKQPVLRDLSLTIPFGETVAIVGANGSGKSTLANLLPRFYDATRGRLMIDGVDVRLVHPKKLRQQIAWVTQDPALFNGSIIENIKYGNLSADSADIEYAMKLAGIDRFLADLPGGIDTQIGDRGDRLSSGQRQRVALARAIVANPRILILDEATSQMDGQTEQLVHTGLRDYLRGRTTIIITHRLSSLALADRVIVMEAGKIVADNPPEIAKDAEQFKYLFAKSA
ncbi:MAG TPA: ABC transporter ATP-binding protein [Pirellulaceae bacterium]|nr:ABC transporter ATP-binding protein [Pirellulaceae bacterium]HMO90850.1 ABC transporter ATP-binding protein [Pirellulaceae bacterium]HMP68674.1 ABC transporter ATP-binding protein [Pirellulaceae bacterium]